MTNRIFDVAIAALGLTVAAPAMAAVALAVKLDSRGPALYAQTRVGRGKRPIRVFKFRTMSTGADTRGPSITAAGDPRITRVGALLRRTKLDELPQLWNVLRGDMSLVGPRPEVPRYVEKYLPEWQNVHSVRPGLTDVASLTFRDEEGLLALADDRERAYTEILMPMKIELALRAIERRGLVHDLLVLARTAAAVVGRGSPADHAVLDEARRRIEMLNNSRMSTNA